MATASASAAARRRPAPKGLDTALAQSRLPGGTALGRAGPRLGVRSVRDLLFYLPRRYEDLRELRTAAQLASLDDGTVGTARLQVARLDVGQTFRRRVQRTSAILRDETGEIEATWFGRRYIERRLREGDRVVVSGKIKHVNHRLTLDNPEFSRDDGSAVLHAGRIVPIYRLTQGLTARTLRGAIRAALDRFGPYPEYLPPALRGDLPEIEAAVEAAHYPESFVLRDRALERLAFDELLALQVGMVSRRRVRGRERANAIRVPDDADDAIRAGIRKALGRRIGHSVQLTTDQLAALIAIRDDVAEGEPMLRLLQGDVGSGKTAVAAYALAVAARAGHQAAILAPTDLLARQHAVTVGDMLTDLGIPVTLLTGSLSAEGRRNATEAIADGQAQVVVGTHALIQESVAFARLALVVIDEQHRFGVEQRAQLEAKAVGGAPHVLLMTATPIPRTLGQVLYADLDVSDLRTAPAGRPEIKTGIKRPDALAGTWDRVREEAAAGHRSFVVVPLIEDSDDATAVAAEAEAARLREVLAPLRVGLVHGRMKAVERDAEMSRFRDGELAVVVGTTVVEVGVDVPEATMMIVQGADRFGLSQLHQLRGRVGRGTAASFCVLVSDAPVGSVAMERLRAVQQTRDGFELAEKDFELRQEGDVLGFAQSGLPALRVASLQRQDHRALAVRARDAAESLVLPSGGLRPEAAALDLELTSGWLASIAAAEPVGAS